MNVSTPEALFLRMHGRPPTEAEEKRMQIIQNIGELTQDDPFWLVYVALQGQPDPAQVMENHAKTTLQQLTEAVHSHAVVVSAKWIMVASVMIASLLAFVSVGGFFWGQQIGFSEGYWSAMDDSLAAHWGVSEYGRPAYEMYKTGVLQHFIDCDAPGWEIHSDFCYPLRDEHGQVFGWPVFHDKRRP